LCLCGAVLVAGSYLSVCSRILHRQQQARAHCSVWTQLFSARFAGPLSDTLHRLLHTTHTSQPTQVKQEPLCINSSHASLATRLVGEQYAAMKSKNSATHQQRQQWLARQQQWQQQHGRPMPLADQEGPRLPKLHQLKDDAYKQAVNKLNLEITRAG
jgi:hypothetical protein